MKGDFSLRVFDRYVQAITWILLALMAVSLFILDNAYTSILSTLNPRFTFS